MGVAIQVMVQLQDWEMAEMLVLPERLYGVPTLGLGQKNWRRNLNPLAAFQKKSLYRALRGGNNHDGSPS